MKKIIVESLVVSQKTAVLEDDKLTELFIEDNLKNKIVANIYRGVVKKVLPGLDACFVDIGFEKLAYLKLPKDERIRSGQDVLVQINKEEIGTKGAKLNLEISLAGRYLVYIPTNDRVTMSNKITDEKERFRLKKIASAVNKEKLGLIIRTEAQGCQHEELKQDIEELKYKYENIIKEYKLGIGPKLLYQEMDFASKYVKDNVNDTVEKIVTNSKTKYEELKKILKQIDKEYVNKLVLEENEDVFSLYRVDSKIEKILSKKVWLKNGGYLIIEKTEALTVVDVNTGKFTGNGKFEETVFETNLEAAKEIAAQLKVRDIGGIIIVDFIDMSKKKYQNKIIETLQEELSKDRRKTEILGMTKLGLLEMTRRRDKEPIDRYYKSECSCCGENFSVQSINSILDNIEKDVMRISKHTSYEKVTIKLNKIVHESIKNNFMEIIDKMSEKYGIILEIESSEDIKYSQINIIYEK